MRAPRRRTVRIRDQVEEQAEIVVDSLPLSPPPPLAPPPSLSSLGGSNVPVDGWSTTEDRAARVQWCRALQSSDLFDVRREADQTRRGARIGFGVLGTDDSSLYNIYSRPPGRNSIFTRDHLLAAPIL